MRYSLLLAAALFCCLFSGCTMPWTEAQNNLDNSKRLRVGMTKSEVLKIMGQPLRDETFCKPDIWYYYVEQIWADGLIAEEECMPLVFENGKLAGWGNHFLTRYRLRRKDNSKSLIIPTAFFSRKKSLAKKSG